MYVLDTDIVRYSLYHPANYPYLVLQVNAVPAIQQWISVVTAQELIAWRLHPLTDGRQQDAPELLENYHNFSEILEDMKQLQVLPFGEEAYRHFQRMRAIHVSTNDRRIAATALANGFHVVTNNRQDFERIQEVCPELAIDDWVAPPLEEGSNNTV